VVVRGLSYGGRRHETNLDEGGGGDGEKTSAGNTSVDGKEGRAVRRPR
jgi:hypothetical protein